MSNNVSLDLFYYYKQTSTKQNALKQEISVNLQEEFIFNVPPFIQRQM